MVLFGRKWLVIELCEPVLVKKIHMGNLELFSSTFENFTVYMRSSSDRSSKDWTSIGTFHAKEERAIQSFNMPALNMYTSFIKVYN